MTDETRSRKKSQRYCSETPFQTKLQVCSTCYQGYAQSKLFSQRKLTIGLFCSLLGLVLLMCSETRYWHFSPIKVFGGNNEEMRKCLMPRFLCTKIQILSFALLTYCQQLSARFASHASQQIESAQERASFRKQKCVRVKIEKDLRTTNKARPVCILRDSSNLSQRRDKRHDWGVIQ